MGEINFKLNWESLSIKEGVEMDSTIKPDIKYIICFGDLSSKGYGGKFCLAKKVHYSYEYFNTLNGKWEFCATNCWRKDFVKLLSDAKEKIGNFYFKFNDSNHFV